MEVTEKYFDEADKYRVTVKVSNERAIPLKFQEEVSDDFAIETAQRILNNEAIAQAEELLLAQLLEEEKLLTEELKWK